MPDHAIATDAPIPATVDEMIAIVAEANDTLLQLNDRAMRLELALRLIRLKVMGDVLDPESGTLRDWLRDWIDGFDNGVVQHGPLGGPMLWPGAMPGACQQLRMWGFEPIDGPHEIKYVGFKREPDDGEVVQ